MRRGEEDAGIARERYEEIEEKYPDEFRARSENKLTYRPAIREPGKHAIRCTQKNLAQMEGSALEGCGAKRFYALNSGLQCRMLLEK